MGGDKLRIDARERWQARYAKRAVGDRHSRPGRLVSYLRRHTPLSDRVNSHVYGCLLTSLATPADAVREYQ